MAMEEALIARLDAAVGMLVGSDADGDPAIKWGDRPRGVLPALVLTKVSPGRDYDHDGWDGLDEPRVQFDAWAATAEAAAELSRAVLAEMEAGADVDGVRFHAAMLDSETWSDEGEQDGGAPLFRVSQDFLFYHEEI